MVLIKLFDSILVILGIISAIVIAVPELGMLAVYTIILFPVALLFWEIPRIFITLLAVRILIYITKTIGENSNKRKALAFGFGLGVLLLAPSILINFSVERNVQSLIADDHNSIELPIGKKIIAIRTKSNSNKSKPFCDAFCLHVLLSGAVEKILILNTQEPHLEPDMKSVAIEYSLEKMDNCAPYDFKGRDSFLSLPKSDVANKTSINAVTEMKFHTNVGECLVSKMAFLNEADLIISIGRLQNEVTGRDFSSGFSRSGSYAHRLTIHEKNDIDKGFIEKYRRTSASYNNVRTPLLPSYAMSGISSIRSVWTTKSKTANLVKSEDGLKPLTRLAINELGLNLYINNEEYKDKLLAKLDSIAKQDRKPTLKEWEFVTTYLKDFKVKRSDERDFKTLLKLFNNYKIPTSWALVHIMRAAKNLDQKELVAELVDNIFYRFNNRSKWSKGLPISKEKNVDILISALEVVPNEFLKPYFPQYVNLITELGIKSDKYSFISRLSVFDKKAIPILLEIIETNNKISGNKYEIRSYPSFYAALKGICLMGGQASKVLPKLTELLNQRHFPLTPNNGSELTIKTFARLGFDMEILWQMYSLENQNAKRDKFDLIIKFAKDYDSCTT